MDPNKAAMADALSSGGAAGGPPPGPPPGGPEGGAPDVSSPEGAMAFLQSLGVTPDMIPVLAQALLTIQEAGAGGPPPPAGPEGGPGGPPPPMPV